MPSANEIAYVLSIGSGESSRIYKTTDAGRTWALQFTNTDPKAFFDAMAFWDAEPRHRLQRFGRRAARDSAHGRRRRVVDARPGRGTAARARERRRVRRQRHERRRAADAITSGSARRRVARVLRSSDGGLTWAAAATPLAAGPSAGIFSIAFRDAEHGIVVGGDYRKEGEAIDNAAITSDGGRTWTMVKGLSGFRSVVAYLPGASTPTLIAVGPQGADQSTDDGRTWTPMAGAPGCTRSRSRSKAASDGAPARTAASCGSAVLTHLAYLISTAIRSAGCAESFASACVAAPDIRTSSAFAFG